MTAPANLIGRKFGRLTPYRREKGKNGHAVWTCRCDCGSETRALATHLKSGRTSSCGCAARELNAQKHTTHGLSESPTYAVWRSMVARCTNPRHISYPDYGGRGIRVCERWLSFENFVADMGQRDDSGPRLTIERRNNDGNYEPSNCYWATYSEQARNRRAPNGNKEV